LCKAKLLAQHQNIIDQFVFQKAFTFSFSVESQTNNYPLEFPHPIIGPSLSSISSRHIKTP